MLRNLCYYRKRFARLLLAQRNRDRRCRIRVICAKRTHRAPRPPAPVLSFKEGKSGHWQLPPGISWFSLAVFLRWQTFDSHRADIAARRLDIARELGRDCHAFHERRRGHSATKGMEGPLKMPSAAKAITGSKNGQHELRPHRNRVARQCKVCEAARQFIRCGIFETFPKGTSCAPACCPAKPSFLGTA